MCVNEVWTLFVSSSVAVFLSIELYLHLYFLLFFLPISLLFFFFKSHQIVRSGIIGINTAETRSLNRVIFDFILKSFLHNVTTHHIVMIWHYVVAQTTLLNSTIKLLEIPNNPRLVYFSHFPSSSNAYFQNTCTYLSKSVNFTLPLGVHAVDTSIWLSSDPENPRTLHPRANHTNSWRATWEHRTTCSRSVWKLCDSTCVGARPPRWQEPHRDNPAWESVTPQSA
jgi:hypothetical protein